MGCLSLLASARVNFVAGPLASGRYRHVGGRMCQQIMDL